MKALAVLAMMLIGCAEERPRGEPAVTGRIHPPGNLDEDSDDFHGKEIARRDYDFALCAKCHGEDFAGGTSGVSCLECHTQGPTACVTCHRPDNESTSHTLHRTQQIACAECHVVPAVWSDPGHLDGPPADVVLRGGGAFAAGRCTNVYCHGATLNAGGVDPAPTWNAPAVGGCDRCHGNPPPSHAQTTCATCHPANAPHIDGIVQVETGCNGCHAALGGAHDGHLAGLAYLRAPLTCSECHVVPASVDSPGHIDSPPPAEVLPVAGWDANSGTCATWCHGAATPAWTDTQITCGSCHPVPPATPSHAGVAPTPTACAPCHPASGHMNGAVDVQ